MSDHPTDFKGDVCEAIKAAIQGKIADADVEVAGGGGHFTITVAAPVFAGKNMLASQRIVYGAIKDLMTGERAPVHAVDTLVTRAK